MALFGEEEMKMIFPYSNGEDAEVFGGCDGS
jgi:hypothetical protein